MVMAYPFEGATLQGQRLGLARAVVPTVSISLKLVLIQLNLSKQLLSPPINLILPAYILAAPSTRQAPLLLLCQ